MSNNVIIVWIKMHQNNHISIFRRYFKEFDPCLVLKVTPEMEPLIIDDIINEDFVPSEEFKPKEPEDLLRLYR